MQLLSMRANNDESAIDISVSLTSPSSCYLLRTCVCSYDYIALLRIPTTTCTRWNALDIQLILARYCNPLRDTYFHCVQVMRTTAMSHRRPRRTDPHGKHIRMAASSISSGRINQRRTDTEVGTIRTPARRHQRSALSRRSGITLTFVLG